MKQYTFKDGFKCVASTKKEAIDQHKATAANKVASAQEEGQCFVLVPRDMLVNKNLILRCKKLWIKDARTVGVQEGLKHSKPARTLDRVIKLINEDM